MARQPEIRLGRIRMPQSTSPQQAENRARNKLAVADSVMRIGQEIGQIKQEYDIGEASATTAARMGEFERKYAGKEMYTPDEVRELGLDNVVKLREGEEERQFIPAHEVYPIALQQAGENAIREGQGKITGTRTRQAWSNEMNSKHQDVVNNAIERSRQNAYRYTVNTMSREASALQESGLFLAAEEKIRSMPIPNNQKKPLLLENAKLQEIDRYNRRMITQNPDELQMVADDIAEQSDAGTLLMNDTEAKNLYLSAVTKRNAAVAEQQRARKALGSQMTVGAFVEMSSTGVVPQEVIDMVQDPRAAQLLGKENLTFLYREMDRIAQGETITTSTELSNWFEIQMASILSGDYGAYRVQRAGTAPQAISTYGEALDDMEAWIKENAIGVDPYTGERTGQISGADTKSWLQRIQDEREFPSTQDAAYKAAVTDLRQRLYGTDAGLLAGLQSTATGSVFANAVGELREAVRDDPTYDIAAWQKNRMPLYLEEAARNTLVGLTGQYEDLQDYVQYRTGDTFGVDGAATQERLMEAVRNPPVGMTREKAEDLVLQYEAWARGIGADYVN